MLEDVILEERKRDPPVVSWKLFASTAAKCGIQDQVKMTHPNLTFKKNQLLRAVSFLKNSGLVFYLENHPALKHHVILNPQWMYDCVATLLEKTSSINGVLKQDDLENIWPNYSGTLFLCLVSRLLYTMSTY